MQQILEKKRNEELICRLEDEINKTKYKMKEFEKNLEDNCIIIEYFESQLNTVNLYTNTMNLYTNTISEKNVNDVTDLIDYGIDYGYNFL